MEFPPLPQLSFTFSNRGVLAKKITRITSIVPMVMEAVWGYSFKNVLVKMMREVGALFLSSKTTPTHVCVCVFKGLRWSMNRRVSVCTILLGLLYSQEMNLF